VTGGPQGQVTQGEHLWLTKAQRALD